MARLGHFDDVIAEIDKMLAELEKEGLDDVTQKAWCISEQHRNEDAKSDKEYKISQIEAKIERAQEAIKKMEKKQDYTRGQIADLVEMWEDAEADRVSESGASAAAKSDDEKAILLLGDAIAALSQYEQNNAFLQLKSKTAKKSKQPVFELDEDAAPTEEFSSADVHQGAQHSIINMMKNIKEELENEVALSDKAEAKAIEDHAALKAEVDKQTDQYNKFIIELDGMIADANKDISDLTDDKTKTEESASPWWTTSARSSRTASGSRGLSTSGRSSARRRRRVFARRRPCLLGPTTSSRRRAETSASFAGCSKRFSSARALVVYVHCVSEAGCTG
jgi:chromosome segregation ATPase